MRMKLNPIPTVVTLAAALAVSLSACGPDEAPADPSGEQATQDQGSSDTGSEGDAGSQTNEYPGEFTVANGDSTFYVGDGPHRPDTVTVTCAETDGLITATIKESRTGNTFTTTQPEAGAGYAGGTLTLGDTGEEITWEPLDDLDEETIRLANSHPDARGDARVFAEEHQEGSPITWEADGTFEFGYGLKVVSDAATYEEQEALQEVGVPGRVDCSGGAAIP